jgi:hypothetical protein
MGRNAHYVRGLRRSREIAIKVALGASRGRLMSDILLEATLLAALAAIVAFAMVVTAGTVVRQLFLPTVAALVSPLDARLILLTVAVCLGATLLLGLLPALRLTTIRMRTPAEGTLPPSRLLDVFTAAQIALSVPLLVGAGLFVLSLLNAANQNYGFDARQVVVVRTRYSAESRRYRAGALLPHASCEQAVSAACGITVRCKRLFRRWHALRLRRVKLALQPLQSATILATIHCLDVVPIRVQ